MLNSNNEEPCSSLPFKMSLLVWGLLWSSGWVSCSGNNTWFSNLQEPRGCYVFLPPFKRNEIRNIWAEFWNRTKEDYVNWWLENIILVLQILSNETVEAYLKICIFQNVGHTLEQLYIFTVWWGKAKTWEDFLVPRHSLICLFLSIYLKALWVLVHYDQSSHFRNDRRHDRIP